MKKMIFVLALLACWSLPARAEAVFDQENSFLIARSQKLGEEGLVSSGRHSKIGKSAAGKKKKVACAFDFYKNSDSDTCDLCPDYASCKDGKTFLCNDGYFADKNKCLNCPANATCKNNALSCHDNYYRSGNACPKCPAHGNCKNNVITCDFGYVLSGEECLSVCDDTITSCKTNPETGSAFGKRREGNRCYCE